MSVSGNRTAAQMCDHDGKPCYVGLGTEDAHWRCGTSACAPPPAPVDVEGLVADAMRGEDMSPRSTLIILDHLAKAEAERDAWRKNYDRAVDLHQAALARVGELEKAVVEAIATFDVAISATTFTKPRAGQIVVNVQRAQKTLDTLRQALRPEHPPAQDGGGDV